MHGGRGSALGSRQAAGRPHPTAGTPSQHPRVAPAALAPDSRCQMCTGDTQVCRPREDTATASSLPPGSPGAALSGCSVCARIELRGRGVGDQGQAVARLSSQAQAQQHWRQQQRTALPRPLLQGGCNPPRDAQLRARRSPAFEEGDVRHWILGRVMNELCWHAAAQAPAARQARRLARRGGATGACARAGACGRAGA